MPSLLNGFFLSSTRRFPRLIRNSLNVRPLGLLSTPPSFTPKPRAYKANRGYHQSHPRNNEQNSSREHNGPFNAKDKPNEAGQRLKYSYGRSAALDILIFTIQGLAIFIVIREHVLDIKWISGASMSPYLNPGYNVDNVDSEMVLVDVTYAIKLHMQRGMVVVFPSLRGSSSTSEPSKLSVKRIIALPGDIVTTRRTDEEPQKSQLVPWNHVWVEGDARDPDQSFDSNTYGPISMNLIKGQVMCVLRPNSRTLKWWEWENEDDPIESGGSHGKDQRKRVNKNAVTVFDPDLAQA